MKNNTKKYNLSKIMKRAWEIKREDSRYIFGECLKMAWEEAKENKNRKAKRKARKLSKAQERTLEQIRDSYNKRLEDEFEFYKKRIDEYENYNYLPLSYYENHLKMVNKGYVLWQSGNSRTLEILCEHGYIDYIKKDENRSCTPIDYVKLLIK